jgi:hypothetical protein
MKRERAATSGDHRVPETRTVDELPRTKAFVLQLRRDSGPGRATFAGRVEHLSTGRRARFETLEELMAALTRLLGERRRS